MKLQDLPLYQTRTIAEAAKDAPTHNYIVQCLNSFFSGNYGEVPPEDTEANNADLEAGEGHVLARYKAFGTLSHDIYIEAHFSQSVPGVDANNIMIMYPEER